MKRRVIIDLVTEVEENESPSLLYDDIRQELCCCWHDVSFTMKHEDEDEPQIFICPIQDNYEALIEDEPQIEEHCETCRHKDKCEGATYEYKNTEWWCLGYAPIAESQTDCPWK